MEFLFALEKLEDSKEFKEWKGKNEKCYLVHGFAMVEEGETKEWQIGYYDKEKDLVTPMEVSDKIKIGEAQEAFKKKESIEPLDIEKVKISAADAIAKNTAKLNEEYSKEVALKTFMVVQNIEEGSVWNVTTATQSLNTINVKIDSETGEVKAVKVQNFMEMQK